MGWNAKGEKTPGSGKPKGRRNNATIERERKFNEVLGSFPSEVKDRFQDIDALGLLQMVYKDSEQALTTRLDAAKTAIRYERAALSSIDVNATARQADPNSLTDAQLATLARQRVKAIETMVIDAEASDTL